ncbi:MAG: hypothetical protein HY669_02055, partial [Chloroflexi bacterium]|nr:hypothetical protein [Chloroflexota bacterium]
MQQYRRDPDNFFLCYQRASPTRLNPLVDEEVAKELALEKQLIEDPSLPRTTYNYAAIKDRLAKHGVIVSLPT